VANLAEDKDGEVQGVLFEIPPPAKDAVLRKEGVATGLSEEIDVFVEAEGKRIAAKAYVARPEKRGEEGPASGRLLAYLIEGAQERGLPEKWVEHLRKQTAESPQPPPAPVGLKVEHKR
jgi:cation transport regulator ChaC